MNKSHIFGKYLMVEKIVYKGLNGIERMNVFWLWNFELIKKCKICIIHWGLLIHIVCIYIRQF